jgi:hypothetical protein
MTDQLTDTQAAAALAGYYNQWIILSPGDGIVPVRPGARYVVKNQNNRHFLRYKDQGAGGGINLGFSSDAEPSTARACQEWQFHTVTGSPVRYGEQVAVRCRDRYVRYGERPFGINLTWTSTPDYQWQLVGGDPGEPVQTDQWLGILNTFKMWPLVYFKRAGADIGWPRSTSRFEQVKDLVAGEAADALRKYIESQSGGS